MVYQETRSRPISAGADEKVTVELEFASAQPNAWTLSLEGDTPITGHDGIVRELGRGRDLRGRFLQVVAHMVDANPATNLLAHRVRVRRGGAVDTLAFENDGATPGDSAVYTSVILFV